MSWNRPYWCSPPCVLPAGHEPFDCWDGTYCQTCPIGCRGCEQREGCSCLADHRDDLGATA